MRIRYFVVYCGMLFGLFSYNLSLTAEENGGLELHTRMRVKTENWSPPKNQHTKLTAPRSERPFTIEYQTAQWEPEKTAIVICDMWDTMCCKIPADRVAELAVHMNRVVKKAREQGVLIIHAPSGNVDFYQGTPQRALCANAPKVETKAPLKWNYLNSEKEAPLPIDDSDNGWEGPVAKGRPQTRQHKAIEIAKQDAVGHNNEVYYLLKQRGIKNVILMGVHTNMCVLGRPFGIRQLKYLGLNVVLMRDMTDCLYNPMMRPYVSHYRGTEMVIEHIEKYWCPTILSTDFLDEPAFRFQGDPRPHVVFMVSDDHYHADKTIPEYAQWLRENHHVHCTVLHGQGEHDIPGTADLDSADVVVVYVRRLGLPTEQIKALQKYVASGKPLIGLRTANHAFTMHYKAPAGFKVPEGRSEWKDFDASILGGNYSNHGPNKLGSDIAVTPEGATHPILKGVTPSSWHSTGSLYFVAPAAKDATVLMTGSIPEKTEPLTWVRPKGKNRGKVMYSSLGHPDDFQHPAFRRMLSNAIDWAIAE